MNERPTPETDEAQWGTGRVTTDFARRLERERDEALKLFISSKRARASLSKACDSLQKELRETKRERDEAREALAEWHDSALHVRQEYEDEQHCSCVPILRKLLKDAERERDEAIADRDIARLSALESDRAHDRMVAELEKVYKERDEAREALARITEAAQAAVDRWEQPAWKDAEPTAAIIYRLRDALGREAK